MSTTIPGFRKCVSVTPGGKPFFYVRPIPGESGYVRIVWNRDVLAYALTRDQKYGDRPTLIGYFSTPDEAASVVL